jgi:hypothetical protein
MTRLHFIAVFGCELKERINIPLVTVSPWPTRASLKCSKRVAATTGGAASVRKVKSGFTL